MILATPPSLTTVAIIVLGIYLLLLLGLGFVGYLKGQTSEEDFYLAGRGQGFIVTVMTIMATFFSSAAILGIPGNIYKDGVAFLLFAMNLPVAGACIYVFGSRIRRIGQKRSYVTQGDMIADYYGDTTAVRIAVAWAGFVYVILYVVMQIKAGGYLAQVMFPQDNPLVLFGREVGMFQIGATLLSIVTMIYVLVGGMRSVAWTDVLQGFLLITGMLLASVATIVSLGGMEGFVTKLSELPPEALSLPGPRGAWHATALLTICMFASSGSIVQPGQWMRLYAARDDRTLKRSSLVFSLVLPFCFLFGVMLVALVGRAIYPPEVGPGIQQAHATVKEFDQIVVVMLKEQLPALMGFSGIVLLAVVLVAILAASMSTADSNLHALSAVLTRDIHDRFIRPKASERERAWVGRSIIVFTTLLALWLVNSMQANPDYEPFRMIADIMFAAIASSCQLLPATIDMLFLRKGTRAGMVSGLITGLIIVFLFTPVPAALLNGFGFGEPAAFLRGCTGTMRSYLDIGFYGVFLNTAVFVIISRFTRPVPKDHVAAFLEDLRK